MLDRGLEDCDALVLLLSAASSDAPTTALALERTAARGWPACITVSTDSTMPPYSLLPLLERARVHSCTDGRAYDALLDAISEQLDAMMADAVLRGPRDARPRAWPPPVGAVGGNQRPGPKALSELTALPQPGWTIHQELLVRPLQLHRDQERTTLDVDRRGVEQVVVTTAAKAALWTSTLGSHAGLAAAEAWEGWVEANLVRGEPTEPPAVAMPCLRWGGAGVLPLVRWRGEDWVPLLFRDIPPVGWNLPLGASGHGDDLNDPITWGRRELLEELIVLHGTPQHGKPIALRSLLLPGRPPREALDEAIDAAAQTLALRASCDQLPVVPGAPSSLTEGAGLEQAIPCASLPTGSDLRVCSEDGVRLHHNLLLAPVPLELGIDVAEILHFELGEHDTILDGEVLERDDGRLELVRMPVAMFRANALRRLFGSDAPALEPTKELPRSQRCSGLRPEDLHIFPWDVRRRRELALGSRMVDGTVPTAERARLRRWHDRLGQYFLDDSGQPSGQRPCDLFVGATARLLQAWARLPR